jgi:hypothetical protein
MASTQRMLDNEDWDAYAKRVPNAAATVAMLDTILKIIEAATTPLHARIKALEERPTIEYKGVFEAGVTYHKGECVTHAGSLWIAKHDTMLKPDEHDGRDWQLCVKRGRDGKDLR